MTRAHVRKEHMLQTKWLAPMGVKEAKPSLVFVVEDSVNAELTTVHGQRMAPYPVTKRNSNASGELREQAMHYEAT